LPALVHATEHLDRIAATAGGALQSLDPDTYTCSRSYEVARLAAGSAEALASTVMRGELDAGFLAVRPPGHHAERDRAMGFCLLNNVAVAAASMLRKGLARRVAIVDFDVHHGNGTQQIFWESPEVLYLSSHQFPFYPGSGDFLEVGAGRGKGLTVNFPLPAGRNDAFFELLYQRLACPILLEFKPDLIVVSAGYDAHGLDPLGGMKMTAEGFGCLSSMLCRVAAETCRRRILFVLEGGYDLKALTASVEATLDAMLGQRRFEPSREAVDGFADYEKRVRGHLAPYWKCMA